MANEAMSRILQTDMMVAVSKVLSLQRRYKNKELPIVLFGDSICVALLFNTTFQLKNTLLRNAIVNTKSRARQIIEYFPNSTVYFSYVPGKLNPADYLSKLFLDPIQAVKSSLWRYGPDLISHKDS